MESAEESKRMQLYKSHAEKIVGFLRKHERLLFVQFNDCKE